MTSASELIRRALTRGNVEAHRSHAVPFGVSWSDDVSHYLQGRALGVAFDVGAHRGETALKLLHAFPGVRVHSFEPLPECFAALQQATAASDVQAVNAAVSDRSGSLTLARGEASYQTSVHGSGEKLEVRAITVDEYAQDQGVDRIDLLKIDTEGHEEAVLRGSVEQLERASIEFVLCECEFTERPEERHADFRAVQDLLAPFGYRVVSFYTGGVDNLGWLWGDVLFRYAPGERDRAATAMSPIGHGAGRRCSHR